MEPGAILIGLAILIACLPFLINPFQRRNSGHLQNIVATEGPDERREAALLSLRDLDIDFRTGKISEEDHSVLRLGLLAEAAQFVRQEQGEDDSLEALIAARRAGRARLKVLRRTNPITTGFCPTCGQKTYATDLFCSACGVSLVT